MLSIAYPPKRSVVLPPVDSNLDAFTQSFSMVRNTFSLSHKYDDCVDFWNGLETVTQMAVFAAKNHVGDPVHLWNCIRPLIKNLQEILEDPLASKAFKRREVARLTKCYHELANAACVFSIAGDNLLRDVLYEDAKNADEG